MSVTRACAAGRHRACRGRVLAVLQAPSSRARWEACECTCHRESATPKR